MSKFIFISQLPLTLDFRTDGSVAAIEADAIGRCAAQMAAKGHTAVMMGEASADAVGQRVVDYLAKAGVDTTAIDRFTDGLTPQIDTFAGSTVIYDSPAADDFDCIWPRVDDTDTVVFGSTFTLQKRVRGRLMEFLNHARARQAKTVYVPLLTPALVPRVIRVMPELIDNLEMADAVVTTPADLQTIYGNTDAAQVFADKLSFYTPGLAHITPGDVTFFTHGKTETIDCASATTDEQRLAIAIEHLAKTQAQ